jgi:hypothetical protein
MDSLFGAHAQLSAPELRTRVRSGIRALAQSAEGVLDLIRNGGRADFTPSAFNNSLGAHLAGMLKELRQQRSAAMDLSLRHARKNAQGNPAFDAYLQALGDMRSTIGLWLTIQAANPETLEVEAADFEGQCFSALGAGILWLDSLAQDEGGQAEEGLSQERVLMEVFAASQRDELPEFSSQNWQLGASSASLSDPAALS